MVCGRISRITFESTHNIIVHSLKHGLILFLTEYLVKFMINTTLDKN